MAKSSITLLGIAFALASAVATAQTRGQNSLGSIDLQTPFVGSSVSCSQTETQKIVVPSAVAGRAKLKARLLNLLRESLFDDSKGVTNVARDREIRKLASKLRNEKPDY